LRGTIGPYSWEAGEDWLEYFAGCFAGGEVVVVVVVVEEEEDSSGKKVYSSYMIIG